MTELKSESGSKSPTIAEIVYLVASRMEEKGIGLPEGWQWWIKLPKKDWLTLCRQTKECQLYKHVPGLDDNVPDEEVYLINSVGICTPLGEFYIGQK